MKVYVNSIDWNGEGDVFFFSIIEESKLEAIKNLLQIYDDLDITYCTEIGWGTNESFDFNTDDIMRFVDDAEDISDEELAVFKKFRVYGLDIYDRLQYILSDAIWYDYSDPYWASELTQKDLDRIKPHYIQLFDSEEWNEIQTQFNIYHEV